MAIRLLLAVDGSPCSDRATQEVVRLAANGLSIDLIVLQVQPFMSLEAQQMHLEPYAQAAMRSARALLDAAGIAHEVRILMGPAASRIVECAGTDGFQLVVLGTHGLGWVNTILVGSVAKKVLDESTAPVLLVR